MAGEIVYVVKLTPAAGQEEALHRTLVDLVTATRREDGCLTYDLYKGQDGSSLIFEIWRDQAALDAHKTAPHLVAAAGQFGTLLAGAPRLEIYEPTMVASLT